MENNKSINPNLLLIGGAFVLAYFGVFNPLLKWIGIKESDEDKATTATNTAGENVSGWSPDYYKRKGGLLLKKTPTESLAKSIWNAKGFFNDNEEQVYGALRQLPSKAALSFLSDVFFQLYQRDLYGFIKDMLSESEMVNVSKIVLKLPVK